MSENQSMTYRDKHGVAYVKSNISLHAAIAKLARYEEKELEQNRKWTPVDPVTPPPPELGTVLVTWNLGNDRVTDVASYYEEHGGWSPPDFLYYHQNGTPEVIAYQDIPTPYAPDMEKDSNKLAKAKSQRKHDYEK